ncbi:MAG TPA: phosphatidylserine/phosphatidylglycerophosphate/cardiolipin synthase family protein, partial [Candidatus Dormibacteraeota bacterium]|nr:phosphatidylserine/phosphatidylglycerophosphate/cardiolipin synthase family protein [Candidatus Dormibacteraeota bacterium]
ALPSLACAVVRTVCLLSFLLSLVGCSSPAAATPALRPIRNEVTLWQDAAIFSLVAHLIDSARHRVLVEMYELGRPDIVRSLGTAESRGVSVRVISDPTVEASRRSASQLDAFRVPERFYPVDDSRHQIDHVKLLVADGEAAVGGMNWGKHSDRNHDYVLEIGISSEVERVTSLFEQDWALAGGHPAPLPVVESDPIAQTTPGGEIRLMLERELLRCSHRALVEMYTLTDAEILADLVFAHNRGAVVRVLLDPNQVYNRHAYTVLRDGGVEARWYPVPKGVLLHAKIGLFDGDLVLGSANWTSSGLGVNHELDVETSDPTAVQAYASRFSADWARSG